jgi:hypothetical protein
VLFDVSVKLKRIQREISGGTSPRIYIAKSIGSIHLIARSATGTYDMPDGISYCQYFSCLVHFSRGI